jgi:hypothetical protein
MGQAPYSGQGGYSHPPGPPQGYPPPTSFVADKILGIFIIIGAVCCGLVGLAAAGIIGLAGGFAGQAMTEGGATAQEAAAATALFGLGGVAVAVIVMVISATNLAVGIGILKSARWGFLLGAIVNGIWFLMQLPSLGENIFSAMFSLGVVVYCVLRITGNLGPRPI